MRRQSAIQVTQADRNNERQSQRRLSNVRNAAKHIIRAAWDPPQMLREGYCFDACIFARSAD
jgi:hypothetical protein